MSDAGDLGWEARVRAVWDSAGEHSENDVVAAVEALTAERPAGDPAACYELASAYDYAGREAAAEPLYRQALEAGLTGERRSSALIQIASTLRNLGRPAEAVDLLMAEVTAGPDDGLHDARAAFLALALGDLGQHDKALHLALTALAPHLPRYQRAVQHYADELGRTPAAPARPDVSTPGWVLRPYEPGDTAATRGVFHAAVRRTALGHYSEAQVRAWAPDEADLDRWDRRRVTATTVVAVAEGGVVGFADLTDAGEMDMLFVHPDHARRGIATALVNHVTDEARRRGMHRVDVRASRVLQPLLERLGFVVDEDRPHNRAGVQVLANAAMHLDLPATQASVVDLTEEAESL